jgi:uncharacterized membrane protein
VTRAFRGFAVALAAFLILDGLWLGLLMNSFYRVHLAALARTVDGALDPIWPAAALVYVLLAAGVAVLIAPRAQSPLHAAALGALFGLVVYGVYDLTNLATLRDWPVIVTVVDIAWGTVACAAAAWLVAAVAPSR